MLLSSPPDCGQLLLCGRFVARGGQQTTCLANMVETMQTQLRMVPVAGREDLDAFDLRRQCLDL